MPMKRRSNGVYYTTFRVRGRQVRRSLDTKSLVIARQRESDLRDQIWRERNLGEKPPATFEDLAADFLETGCRAVKPSTANRYATSIKAITPFFQGCVMSSLDTTTLSTFVARRVDQDKVSDSTIRRDLTALSVICRYAVRQGKLGRNPIPDFDVSHLKESAARDRVLTDLEYQRLLQECPPYLARMVVVARETGLRFGEQTALTWDDIVPLTDRRFGARVRTSKNGKGRTVPLTEPAVAAIRNYKKSTASQLVFWWGPEGKPIRNIKTAWRTALKKAGIADFRWHDLRHCAATRWRQSGMSIDRIKELLGHSSLNMAMRYASLHPDDLIQAMDAFEQKTWVTKSAHPQNDQKQAVA